MPQAYPSKLQIATPASKTNIHTHTNYKTTTKTRTTTAKMLQLKYTMSLCTEETDIMIKQAQNKIQSTTVHNTESLLGLQGDLSMSLIPSRDCQKGVCHLYVRWQSPHMHAREDRRRFNKLAVPSPLPRASALPNVRVDAGCSSC